VFLTTRINVVFTCICGGKAKQACQLQIDGSPNEFKTPTLKLWGQRPQARKDDWHQRKIAVKFFSRLGDTSHAAQVRNIFWPRYLMCCTKSSILKRGALLYLHFSIAVPSWMQKTQMLPISKITSDAKADWRPHRLSNLFSTLTSLMLRGPSTKTCLLGAALCNN
jgi:hypothetical protein